MLQTGDTAPDFVLPDQDGREVALSHYRGQRVVVYFYPKAGTSGCTTQACGVRDRQSDYEAAGAVTLGISPDPVAAVKRFHDKEGLNFSLLADEDHAVSEAYGVWGEKSMYGNTYMGASRSTFVIDENGEVVGVIEKAKPKTHDDEVLELLGGLGDKKGPRLKESKA
jgi:peroxiredoxin Q/BCP